MFSVLREFVALMFHKLTVETNELTMETNSIWLSSIHDKSLSCAEIGALVSNNIKPLLVLV